MIIESIELKDFRNYKNLSMEFDSKTNILYGDNAQGKTNILEAVYYSATTKSHKGSKDREVINFDSDEAHIKTVINKKGIPYRVDMHLKKNKPKGIAINGIPIKKASELFGILNVVLFSPEDLHLIKSGPSERRRFLDLELCQLDKIYVYNMVNYNKVLDQRNQLLKVADYRPDLISTIDIWDNKLVEYGKNIIESRHNFINSLNEIIYDIHRNLSAGKEELRIIYLPDVEKDNFYEELLRNREKDKRYKTTSVGPHRDDFMFKIADNDVRKFGSQGQQRTVALSLKLAEIKLVSKIINDNPVLLLDDVLSELDENRQNQLLNNIGDIQTMITCTGLDDFIKNRFEIDKLYHIENGSIVSG
ncbi:MAG: DNA replication/repair protein RecF [Lachnospiraceae bacterium]|nr:DNA replication/repair protein RecF [Lachnospiraceae bacterium]